MNRLNLHNLGPEPGSQLFNPNKVYCIYGAPGETMIIEHANGAGLPANAVNKVLTIIDPVTAED